MAAGRAGVVLRRPPPIGGTRFLYALAKLPVVLPFALATIVGGIDCTESAAAAGDEYDTRPILLTEGVASLVAGLLGGVIQTTPYIGHPAYKKMGGRAAYTLATALFVGVAGYFGWFQPAVRVAADGGDVPDPGVRRPGDHGPIVPSDADAPLSSLGPGDDAGSGVPDHHPAQQVLGPPMPPPDVPCRWCRRCAVWRTASSSRVCSGRRRWPWCSMAGWCAAAFLLLAGVCAFFGVIHSPLASERIGLPYDVLPLVQQQTGGAGSGMRCGIRRHITGRRRMDCRR